MTPDTTSADGPRRGLIAADRAVLRVAGEEARDWLQGLVTNDVRRLGPGAAVYAALLSPQGKYLFDFVMVEDADGTVLLDVAADRAAALAQRLGMYRLRRRAGVEATALQVALVWGGEGAPDAVPLCVADPRTPALGWRLYGPDAAALLAAAGAAPADPAERDALRVANAAPESGVELIPEDSYVLEAGFDRLNGVDFRKGCYVGQEVTARMRHKTELRKGLVRVALDGPAPPPGTEVLDADGRPAGVLFTAAGDSALAHLRFDRAEGAMTAAGVGVRRIG